MTTDLQKLPKIESHTGLQAIWTIPKTLMRTLDINVTEGQARWIKYKTWSCKKMKKKKKKKKKKELV